MADISLTGGLYFFTSAFSRPLAVTTKIWGFRLTLAVGSTVSSSLRLAASSRSDASPGCSPIFLSTCGRQAVVTARWACWFASQRGGSWAGWTTWPLVISQPSASRNQPVPVSRKTGGVIFCGPEPDPQSSVTSEATSATTSTTAGLARWRASWTVMGFWAEAVAGRKAAAMTTAAPNSAERSIIGPLRAILH